MSVVDRWFPDVWASAEDRRRVDTSSFFAGWLQLAGVAALPMFFISPRAGADAQSGAIVVSVLGVLLVKPRIDPCWSHGRAGSIDGRLRVALAISLLSVCIGLAAAFVRMCGLTVSPEPTLYDLIGWLIVFPASCVGAGIAGLAGLLPGGTPGAFVRPLRGVVVVALFGAIATLAVGVLAYVRRDAGFDQYLSNLPELSRLAWPAKGDPWQSTTARSAHQFADVGALRVCALRGPRVAVARLPGGVCDERGAILVGIGAVVLREDASRGAVFVQLQGDPPLQARAFVGHDLHPLMAVPHDWLGPRRPPLVWLWLSGAGLVVAVAGLARSAGALRQAANLSAWRSGVVTDQGAFAFDDGGTVSLPAHTTAPPGPAVWVTLTPTRDATYRTRAEPGDARVVAGSLDDLRLAVDDAESVRAATALAVMSMTSAPLVAALCVG